MQFVFTDEQVLIQDTARGFFAERSTSALVRKAIEEEAGYDASLWQAIAAELGFTGIAIPAEYGGSGLGQVEQSIVMMEMGRTLCASPYLPSIAMAAQAILAAGTEAQKARLLPALASGETIATLAYLNPSGRGAREAVLTPADGGYTLSGSAGLAAFGHAAGLFIVAADAPGGVSLVVLDRGMVGLSVERHASLDPTRPLSTLRFDDIVVDETRLLGGEGDARAALTHTIDLARVAIVAEQAGGAEAVLDLTVAYSKDRVQFGRPIGSFQALKHRMADMMVVVETAKTAAYYAAATADETGGDIAEAAAIAKAYCSDAFTRCAGDAIQLHGGIGFTWEHDAQLFFKRARASATLLGDPAELREVLACRIGLGEAA